MNLIPGKPGLTPNYYCTWGAQNGFYNRKDNPEKFTGSGGAQVARHSLTEETVFGDSGMAREHDRIRGDLYFVLDDGWDVPYTVDPNTARYEFGSLMLNEEKFASCSGAPEVRLQKMNDMMKNLGWKGVGLWIASQAQGETSGNKLSLEQSKDFWKERILWSKYAGVEYWKVDWGVYSTDVSWRRMLTQLGKELYPELFIEQCRCMGCTNDNNNRFAGWDNVTDENLAILAFSDVFRSYDAWDQLSVATTMDRLGVLLTAEMEEKALGIINVEDEPYIGAALGCAIGIMRTRFRPTRRTTKLMDEATRAIMWQRIAPAFGVKETKSYVSDELLTDAWFFEKGEVFATELDNKELTQIAPNVVSRGINLPRVKDYIENAPYVVAAKNPNGAVSISTLPRSTGRKIEFPLSTIEFDVGDSDVPIGIFGLYNQLILNFTDSVSGKKVYVQDLAGYEAQDITNLISCKGNQLVISGEVISKAGLSNASENDLSSPGLVMVLK